MKVSVSIFDFSFMTASPGSYVDGRVIDGCSTEADKTVIADLDPKWAEIIRLEQRD